ncbi:MAG: hypothetical protein WKF43_00130 [Acidimicrobiales bacterium]
MPFFLLGGGLLVLAVVVARFGIVALGPFLVLAGALVLASAFGRRIVRKNPDEPWVGRLIMWGVIAKLVASYARYLTLVYSYEGRGDAADYDSAGRLFARAWMGDGQAPVYSDLRKSNFLRWFTGVVYYLFGTNFMVGFFVFGLLALLGSYFWYRATVSAVPFIDKRLYLMLVLFVPSIVFWPSSIGKESLMQLGIGAVTLGIAMLMRTRVLAGLVICVAGGWLLWVVRPHLLAMVAVSGGVAYAVGRVRQKDGAAGSLVSRPLGILIVAFLVIFTISQGAHFLGLEELSLTSIENELDATTESTSQGGSEYDTGGNSLNPLKLPEGAVTVLLRPFPWETESPLQLLASAESALLAIALVLRLRSLRLALTRARTQPFLMYCWILVAIYAATFSSFANFGLLTRQRSLVLPAVYVLLALKPPSAGDTRDSKDPASGDVPLAAGVH